MSHFWLLISLLFFVQIPLQASWVRTHGDPVNSRSIIPSNTFQTSTPPQMLFHFFNQSSYDTSSLQQSLDLSPIILDQTSLFSNSLSNPFLRKSYVIISEKSNKYVLGFDTTTNSDIFRFAISQATAASISLVQDDKDQVVLLVNTNQNMVFILDSNTGKVVQRLLFQSELHAKHVNTDATEEMVASSIIQDTSGILYILNGFGTIYLFNNSFVLMKKLFIQELSNYDLTFSKAALSEQNQLLLLCAANISQNYLAAISVTNFSQPLQWLYKPVSKIELKTPIVIEQFGFVCFAQLSNSMTSIIALHLTNGTQAWKWDVPNEDEIIPYLTLGTDSLFITSMFGVMYSIDASKGVLNWKSILEFPFPTQQTTTVSGTSVSIPNGRDVIYTVTSGNSNFLVNKLVAKSGQLLWVYNATVTNGEIITTSAPSIGMDGSIYFSLVTRDWNNKTFTKNSGIHIVTLSDLKIATMEPLFFYSDSSSIITLKGTFSKNIVDVKCIVHKFVLIPPSENALNYFIMDPIFTNHSTVQCDLSSLPTQFKLVNNLFGIQLAIPTDVDNYVVSNIIQFQFYNPIRIDDQNPVGIPHFVNHSVIQVMGNGFVNNKPETLTPLETVCRLRNVYDPSAQPFIVAAEVMSDSLLYCKVNHLDLGKYAVEVSTAYDKNSKVGRFWNLKYLFFVYAPPIMQEFSFQMIPIQTQKQLSFMIKGDHLLQPFLDEQQTKVFMQCSFVDEEYFMQTDASCEQISSDDNDDDVVAQCKCTWPSIASETNTLVFGFSINGNDFSISNSSFLVYQQPTLIDSYPKSGNMSGGTLIFIQGTNFFKSDVLTCKFGIQEQLLSKATFHNSSFVSCLSPSPHHGDDSSKVRDPLLVGLSIAQNGLDFIGNSNLTFTFENYFICKVADCNGRGKCDAQTGICICNSGFEGDYCDIIIKYGYWEYVLIGLFVLSFALLVILLALFLICNYRKSDKYSKLVEERKNNDISTSL